MPFRLSSIVILDAGAQRTLEHIPIRRYMAEGFPRLQRRMGKSIEA